MKPDPQCPKCNGRGYRPESSREGMAEVVACDCGGECPDCGDRRVIETMQAGYQAVRPCHCRNFHRRLRLFNAADIPARNLAATFHRPNPQLIASSRQVEKAWGAAYAFAQVYDDGQRGFLLYGEPGTLKTSILCATLHWLTLERGIDCRFIEFSLLLSRIRESMGGGSSTPLEPIRSSTVLAIDELGKMRGTDWERAMLDDLISSRYQAGRTTLFATNFPARSAGDKQSPGKRETLEQVVGERIYSRLCEMCDFHFTGSKDVRRRFQPHQN